MPDQNCWVFYDRRTNPATVHRFNENGNPSAVAIHVMRDQQVDADHKGSAKVEDVVMAGAGNTEALTHLPRHWQSEDWGDSDRGYIGPRGILFVWENEYANPHLELANAQRKRIAASTVTPPVTEEMGGTVLSVDEGEFTSPSNDEVDEVDDGKKASKQAKKSKK